MFSISLRIVKLIARISGKHEILVSFYRRKGAHIGQNCLICTPLIGDNPWLISIGDNTVVSTNVEFVLHDFSASRVFVGKSNFYGRIVIGNNCFIGARSIVMYGVSLADNIIVAAGSVVTHSFNESNIIIGGNPARKIGTWDDMRKKHLDHATYASTIREDVAKNPDILVVREVKKY